MSRYFELDNKFWEITKNGAKAYTCRWGKIGSKGQSKRKDFDDKARCTKAFDKLVKTKEQKGYKEQKTTKKRKLSSSAPAPKKKKAKTSDSGSKLKKLLDDEGSVYLVGKARGGEKFWEVSVEGKTMITCYGKVGNKGRTQKKKVKDPESEAIAMAQKKIKGGYTISSKDEEEEEEEEEVDDMEEEEESSEEKETLKFTGAAPVDKHCPWYGSGEVLESDGCVWNAMLNQTNITSGSNNNKFYVLQVLKRGPGFALWGRWGRVGVEGQNSMKILGKDSAIAQFKKKFKDKTKNNWDDRAVFVKHSKKYQLMEIDYGVDDDSSSKKKKKKKGKLPPCKLEKKVQSLVELLFDEKVWEKSLMEIGFDAKKNPLGKIKKLQVTKGYKILKDLGEEIEKKTGKSKQKIEELCSQFYTLIPHTFGMSRPPLIDTSGKLKIKLELVEALGQIELASRMLDESVAGGLSAHPTDQNYKSLKTKLKWMDPKQKMHKIIKKYCQTGIGPTHDFDLKVQDVYEIERDGENKRFKKFAKNKNRMLLWHGSRLTNFVGILSTGLRIAPPEAPVSGYMFGKGVYFADMCSKSANYCRTSRDNPEGIMLLCEVALGDYNPLFNADYNAADLPKGKLSTKGVGIHHPNPKTYVNMDNGCVIPTGKPANNPEKKSVGYLQYNEFIVYDVSQIRIKYLLKVKFNYKSGGFNW